MTGSHLTTPHLTNEQLDDVLIGCATAEAERHAAECAVCSGQIDAFQTSMTVFNTGTMAWAQAKSNTVSRDLSSARISTSSRQPVRWSMGVASTAALAFVFAIGVHRAPDTGKPAEQTVASASAEEIASDNEMLQAIHSETSGTAAPAPLRPYHARVSGSSHRNSSNEVQN